MHMQILKAGHNYQYWPAVPPCAKPFEPRLMDYCTSYNKQHPLERGRSEPNDLLPPARPQEPPILSPPTTVPYFLKCKRTTLIQSILIHKHPYLICCRLDLIVQSGEIKGEEAVFKADVCDESGFELVQVRCWSSGAWRRDFIWRPISLLMAFTWCFRCITSGRARIVFIF